MSCSLNGFPPSGQVVTNKYMRTLALVKQDTGMTESVENVLEEDTLNLEATTLTKDDKDFKVYMGSGEYTGIYTELLGTQARRGLSVYIH